jgi:hypothetical protein
MSVEAVAIGQVSGARPTASGGRNTPAAAAASAPAPTGSSGGTDVFVGVYSLRYDSELGKVFVEAHDPVTGRIIVQMPPAEAARLFAAHNATPGVTIAEA